MAVIKYGCTPCPALFLGQKSSLHRIESGVQAAFGFVDGRICSNIFDMKKQPAH